MYYEDKTANNNGQRLEDAKKVGGWVGGGIGKWRGRKGGRGGGGGREIAKKICLPLS